MNHLEPRSGIKPEVMPGVSGKIDKKNTLTNYTVKYFKADLNEPADLLELSDIETRAIHSKPGDEDVVLLDKTGYSFMDRYFFILKYLEKTI